MVMGAGNGYDLGNSQRRGLFGRAFKLCRVINVAGSDDDALTGHRLEEQLHGPIVPGFVGVIFAP